MSNAGSRRISIAALIGNPSERNTRPQQSGVHPADAAQSDGSGTTDIEATQHGHGYPVAKSSDSHSSVNPIQEIGSYEHQADRFISHKFPQQNLSSSGGQFSDENHAQNAVQATLNTAGNELMFEFYNPLEKKKPKQRSTAAGTESAHKEQTATPYSQFSTEPQLSAQTEFVFEQGTSKIKKERKTASGSGKGKTAESSGAPKSLKKAGKDHETATRRQTTSIPQVPSNESTGPLEVASQPPQQRAGTSSSTTETASHSHPGHTHVSKASQSSGVPDDTTVDDDIMADLDLAELSHVPQTISAHVSSSRAASQPRYSMDHDGDLDMEILSTPSRDRSVSAKPSVSPAPPSISLLSSTASKLPAKTSAALAPSPAPSPSPSSFLAPAPVTGTKKGTTSTTSKSKAKSQATSSKATKKKNDGPARGNTKSKTDGQQKGKDADWAWGTTSSGRAAAAAAANALLLSGGYDEGIGSGRDGTPMSNGHGAGNAGDDGDEDDEEVDTRLYCICRERYDHRFMLGCDHCDEWFHPLCLGMEDFQCDLLEHFYCASCRKADPSLVTTWRVRCANGVHHPFPDSAEACWRAALPPLSKYCSKECGIEAMERKIAPYVQAKAGLQIPKGNAGDESLGFIALPRNPAVKTEMTKLWKGVKDARKRDAVVVDTKTVQGNGKTDDQSVRVVPATSTPSTEFSRLTHTYTNLTQEFSSLARESQFATRDLEFILARGRLAKLAIAWSEKQENLARCCFDSRLLLEGREWEEWVVGVGKAVLEGGLDAPIGPAVPNPASSGSGAAAGAGSNPNEGRTGTPGEQEEEDFGLDIEADSPWCDGRRKCERHFGWQKLCMAEYELNKGTKELALQRTVQKKNDVQHRIEAIQTQLEGLQLQSQGSETNLDVKKEDDENSRLGVK